MQVSMSEEVSGAEFGDVRLSERLVLIAEAFGDRPNHSIPGATSGRAELEAAYRFFDNHKVTPAKILKPHFEATLKRIREVDVALLVQDTTELDLTRPEELVLGAGPMDCEARRGAFYHPVQSFDLDGVPLGMVHTKSWARTKIDLDLSPAEKAKKRRETPIEDKESLRWVEGVRASRDVAQACPETTCVCVGDSESDIYEVFCDPSLNEQENLHLLVRACQTRATTDQSNWLATVRSTESLYQCNVAVSARTAKISEKHAGKRSKSRKARTAAVEIRASTVTLRPPPRFDRKLPSVKVNIVLIEEPNHRPIVSRFNGC